MGDSPKQIDGFKQKRGRQYSDKMNDGGGSLAVKNDVHRDRAADRVGRAVGRAAFSYFVGRVLESNGLSLLAAFILKDIRHKPPMIRHGIRYAPLFILSLGPGKHFFKSSH